jgi:hypothetical protein
MENNSCREIREFGIVKLERESGDFEEREK